MDPLTVSKIGRGRRTPQDRILARAGRRNIVADERARAEAAERARLVEASRYFTARGADPILPTATIEI